jgi:probable F420-dependent oxidoreductase
MARARLPRGADPGDKEASVDKRIAVTVPLEGYTLDEHAPLMREAEALGYRDAWSWEADGLDAFSPLAVAGLTSRLRLGTAIVNVFTRGPATLAQCAAGIAEIAPARFCLGIGAGSNVIVQSWNGLPFQRPATRVREMATFLRRALTGERVVFRGETFAVDGFRLSRPPAHPVPIYIAALRAGMLSVAGEVGDGVILNWLAPEDVSRCVAIVRESARRAGRDPQAIEVTCRIFAHVDSPSPEADTATRRHVAAYLNVPVYRAFHEWLGRTPELGPMWEAWSKGDRRGAVTAIPEAILDQLLLRGSPQAMRARVRRYLEAGIDTVFLSFQSSEPDPARHREVVRAAMRALAPAAG